MRLIDLTLPLDEKTPAYPGDPQIEIEQIAELKENGWREKRLHFNSHCGTHVDAPAHFFEKGKTLDDLSLEDFQGEGIIFDVRRRKITLSVLKEQNITPRSVVLFCTGQSDKRYGNYYEGANFLSEEVAHELVRRKVKAIGVDAFSPDTEPYPVHKILLSKDILIIENLVNLKALLGKRFTIHYFPLNITGGDGGPCRAVAFVE